MRPEDKYPETGEVFAHMRRKPELCYANPATMEHAFTGWRGIDGGHNEMKRDFLFLHCQDAHKWEFVGGRNCGCEDGACSVPVHRCSNCGDYDYGDNDDARQVKKDCEELFPPAPRERSEHGTKEQDDGNPNEAWYV